MPIKPCCIFPAIRRIHMMANRLACIAFCIALCMLASACSTNTILSTGPQPEGTMDGVIHIRSVPDTARIYQDGHYIGTTPLNLHIWYDQPKTTRIVAVPISPNQFTQHEKLTLPDIPGKIIFYMNQPDEAYLATSKAKVAPESAISQPAVIHPEPALDARLYIVNFSNNSSTIASTDHAALVDLAASFRNKTLSVDIHGYTDSRGSRAANIALAEKRAAAVKVILAEAGIAAENIQVTWHGERESLTTAEGMLSNDHNRIVEIWFRLLDETGNKPATPLP